MSLSLFEQGIRLPVRLLLSAVLCVVFMLGDARYQMLGAVRAQLSVLLHPLQWAAALPFQWARQGAGFLTRQARLISENQTLHMLDLIAKTQAARLSFLEKETAHLLELSAYRDTLPVSARLSKIRDQGKDPFSAFVTLDQGSRAGIEQGQIAVDHHGVLGQVIRTQPFSSHVRLIVDRDHLVPVLVERTQFRTILHGMGPHQPPELKNMPKNIDLQEGDILLTSGLDRLYPPGLPVARVVTVVRPAGALFAVIRCEVLGKVNQHRFVLLLSGKSDKDQSAASEPTR